MNVSPLTWIVIKKGAIMYNIIATLLELENLLKSEVVDKNIMC